MQHTIAAAATYQKSTFVPTKYQEEFYTVQEKHRPTCVGFLLLRCTTSVHGLLATVKPRFTDFSPDPNTASRGRAGVPAGALALDASVFALTTACRTGGTFPLEVSAPQRGRRHGWGLIGVNLKNLFAPILGSHT